MPGPRYAAQRLPGPRNMIYLPSTMNDTHSCSYRCTEPACIAAQRDELREKYFALVNAYEDLLNQTATTASFRERLATSFEEMRLDKEITGSLAHFVRNFK